MIQQARTFFLKYVADFAALGYDLTFTNGLTEWQHLMRACGSPENPAFAAVPDDLGLSFNITKDGESAGHGGVRLYQGVRNISDLLESGRLWWSPAESLANDLDYVPLPEDWPLISGNVIQPGGYFIHKAHRKKKLGSILDRAIRCAAITAFQANHFVGISKSHIALNLPQGFYTHTRQELVVRDLPLAAAPSDLYLTHGTRDEFMARLFHENQNVQTANGAIASEYRVQ